MARNNRRNETKQRVLPSQTVTLIAPDGLRLLAAADVTSLSVGQKALGLAALPPGWTLPYFVVDATCVLAADSQVERVDRTIHLLNEALAQISPDPGSLVVVRSSGTAETLSQRGRLQSTTCRRDQVAATLAQLQAGLRGNELDRGTAIHWIVQLKADSKQYGHLSNERRLREESRDWIVEFETQASQSTSFAVRQWRDGKLTSADTIHCKYSADLPAALKQVAQWGTQFADRLHFEWVWDGSRLYVVQADIEEGKRGVNPRLLPDVGAIGPTFKLNEFRVATAEDFHRYRKLRNVSMYEGLGYTMPSFYVLDSADAIAAILSGHPTRDSCLDLQALTRQPLIFRVDGSEVPESKREMLPRSDELRSLDAAQSWLTEAFATQVKRDGIDRCGLCLIGHHFLPAAASAWARAEPGARWVRIESLWGVPEGLYWYSHDTFEVDTLVTDPTKLTETPLDRFHIRERRRYKGIFVAPNRQGEWIAHSTMPPYDWSRSIQKDAWVREIALTTRRIAIAEDSPAAVMWFVELHPGASRHSVLPWFHVRSDPYPQVRAAPRRKISSHRDFLVQTHADWEALKSLGDDRSIDRVTVEPHDPSLIRNLEFAESIADLAHRRGWIVELAGGILSHIYYVLTRRGCQVECVDLYGADEETLGFNKIVRDEIPKQIEEGGEKVQVVRLEGAALVAALKRKLLEESFEVVDASGASSIKAELADVLEVVSALCSSLGISLEEIESERDRKKSARGGFARGLMLVQTSTPHTLPVHEDLRLEEQLTPGLVDTNEPVPASATAPQLEPRLAVKPDLRAVGGLLEKLVTFTTELPALDSKHGSTTFQLPINGGNGKPEITLEIELERSGSELKGAIRLRGVPAQYSFAFDEDD